MLNLKSLKFWKGKNFWSCPFDVLTYFGYLERCLSDLKWSTEIFGLSPSPQSTYDSVAKWSQSLKILYFLKLPLSNSYIITALGGLYSNCSCVKGQRLWLITISFWFPSQSLEASNSKRNIAYCLFQPVAGVGILQVALATWEVKRQNNLVGVY